MSSPFPNSVTCQQFRAWGGCGAVTFHSRRMSLVILTHRSSRNGTGVQLLVVRVPNVKSFNKEAAIVEDFDGIFGLALSGLASPSGWEPGNVARNFCTLLDAEG